MTKEIDDIIEEREEIECERCTISMYEDEATPVYGVLLCDSCSCMDEDELEKLYGEGNN